MPQTIDVGDEEIEFPDSYTPDQITAAVRKHKGLTGEVSAKPEAETDFSTGAVTGYKQPEPTKRPMAEASPDMFSDEPSTPLDPLVQAFRLKQAGEGLQHDIARVLPNYGNDAVAEAAMAGTMQPHANAQARLAGIKATPPPDNSATAFTRDVGGSTFMDIAKPATDLFDAAKTVLGPGYDYLNEKSGLKAASEAVKANPTGGMLSDIGTQAVKNLGHIFPINKPQETGELVGGALEHGAGEAAGGMLTPEGIALLGTNQIASVARLSAEQAAHATAALFAHFSAQGIEQIAPEATRVFSEWDTMSSDERQKALGGLLTGAGFAIMPVAHAAIEARGGGEVPAPTIEPRSPLDATISRQPELAPFHEAFDPATAATVLRQTAVPELARSGAIKTDGGLPMGEEAIAKGLDDLASGKETAHSDPVLQALANEAYEVVNGGDQRRTVESESGLGPAAAEAPGADGIQPGPGEQPAQGIGNADPAALAAGRPAAALRPEGEGAEPAAQVEAPTEGIADILQRGGKDVGQGQGAVDLRGSADDGFPHERKPSTGPKNDAARTAALNAVRDIELGRSLGDATRVPGTGIRPELPAVGELERNVAKDFREKGYTDLTGLGLLAKDKAQLPHSFATIGRLVTNPLFEAWHGVVLLPRGNSGYEIVGHRITSLKLPQTTGRIASSKSIAAWVKSFGPDAIFMDMHNHNGEITVPSPADKTYCKDQSNALEATGVKYGGHVVTDHGTYGNITMVDGEPVGRVLRIPEGQVRDATVGKGRVITSAADIAQAGQALHDGKASVIVMHAAPHGTDIPATGSVPQANGTPLRLRVAEAFPVDHPLFGTTFLGDKIEGAIAKGRLESGASGTAAYHPGTGDAMRDAAIARTMQRLIDSGHLDMGVLGDRILVPEKGRPDFAEVQSAGKIPSRLRSGDAGFRNDDVLDRAREGEFDRPPFVQPKAPVYGSVNKPSTLNTPLQASALDRVRAGEFNTLGSMESARATRLAHEETTSRKADAESLAKPNWLESEAPGFKALWAQHEDFKGGGAEERKKEGFSPEEIKQFGEGLMTLAKKGVLKESLQYPLPDKAAQYESERVSPEDNAMAGKATRGKMRELLGETARRDAIAFKIWKGVEHLVDRLNAKTNGDAGKEFWQGIQSRRDTLRENPTLKPVIDMLESALDARGKEITDLAPHELVMIEDYFKNLWKDPKAAGDFLRDMRQRNPLEGDKGFMKERIYKDIQAGLQHGLELATENPIEALRLSLHQMDKFLMGRKLLNWGLENNVFVDMGAEGARSNVGMQKLAIPGNIWAPEAAAKVVNRYLTPGLSDSTAYKTLRNAGNTMLMARLGWSAFHIGFTSLDAYNSSIALGFKRMGSGIGNRDIGQFMHGVANIPGAFLKPFTNPAEAGKYKKEYLNPGSQSPEVQVITSMMARGNMNMSPADMYHTSGIEQTLKAIRTSNFGEFEKGGKAPLATGKVVRDLWNTAKASGPAEGLANTYHLAQAVIETPTRGVMHVAQLQKIGVAADMIRFEMEDLVKKKGYKDFADAMEHERPEILDEIADRVVNSVDNRMGMLNKDNLFWNNTVKDVLALLVQSTSWNYGTIAEIGGGLWNTRKLATGDTYLNGEKAARLQHNTAYLAAMPVGTALIGAMTQFLYTGQLPSSAKDCYFPRTGRQNADGSDERLSLPTYMKDLVAYFGGLANDQGRGLMGRLANEASQLGSIAAHKAHPLISRSIEFAQNKDFYGNQIWDPDGTTEEQLMQTLKSFGDSFKPYAFSGAEQRAKTRAANPDYEPKHMPSFLDKAAPFVGFTPASAKLSRSPLVNEMSDYKAAHRDPAARTFKEQDKREAKDLLRNAVKSGSEEDIDTVLGSGRLTDKEMQSAMQQAGHDPLEGQFRSLPMDEMARLWKMASKDEKERLAPYLYNRATKSVKTEEDFNKYEAVFDDMASYLPQTTESK